MFRVIHREVFKNNRAVGAGYFFDFFCQIKNRHFGRIPNIDRPRAVKFHQFQYPFYHIPHITETSRLRSVTIHGKLLTIKRLVNKIRYGPSVFRTHPFPVCVKYSHYLYVKRVFSLVREHHRFGKPFRFVVYAPGSNRVHVPPICFRLRINFGISVNFRCRCLKKRSLMFDGKFQRVMCAERAGL